MSYQRGQKGKTIVLPERIAIVTLLIAHLLFQWQVKRLCTHVEHIIDFAVNTVVLQAISDI